MSQSADKDATARGRGATAAVVDLGDTAGVCRGPNLTFSQGGFNNNNNNNNNKPRYARDALAGGSVLLRAFRWRSARISECSDGGNAAATAADVAPNDGVKRSWSDESIDFNQLNYESTRSTRRRWGWFVEGGSEFLATALLMFVGCLGAYAEMDRPSANAYGSVAFGMAVFMGTALFGDVSGAHMNPLVTLVSLAFGKVRWARAVLFMLCQTAGALAGVGLLHAVVPEDVQAAVRAGTRQGAVCCTVPLDSMTSWGAVLAEFVVTSILLSAVCAGLHPAPGEPPRPPPAFQFGLLVAGVCLTEAMYTGASMNPARSLATAAWTGVWDRFWVYLVGQSFSLAAVVGVYAVFRQRGNGHEEQ